MKRFPLAVFSLLVSWLAVSLILAMGFGVFGNPLLDVSPTVPSTGAGLTGLLIFVLTLLLARPVFRAFERRLGHDDHPAR